MSASREAWKDIAVAVAHEIRTRSPQTLTKQDRRALRHRPGGASWRRVVIGDRSVDLRTLTRDDLRDLARIANRAAGVTDADEEELTPQVVLYRIPRNGREAD